MVFDIRKWLSSGLHALVSILSVRIYYKSNRFSPLEAIFVVLVPQVTGYLVEANTNFGFKFSIQNFPSILIIGVIIVVYSSIEFGTRNLQSIIINSEKLILLSLIVYVIALLFNLLYSGLFGLFGFGNPWAVAILGYYGDIGQAEFAVLYGVPFLVASVIFIGVNTLRATSVRRFWTLFKSPRFLRTLGVCVCCGTLQYVAFTVAKSG